jgi:DNA gyrase subunit A
MADQPSRIREQPVIEEMQDSYLTYAMSVIMSRALPDVRDGLKPSQRRILLAMNDLNLGPRSQHRKCAKISGDTSGNYHPHGDQVIYPTMVRMAQPWSLRVPLVDGQGNFGSIDGDPPAAMRYTEARLTAPATELLADLNLDTVRFEPNFDETRKEPVVLPGKFPNLLVNGADGIAVGMATHLPPHNLGEMCDAIVKVLDEPEVTIESIMQVLPGPDFPTGGTICGRKGIVDAYRTGRGTIRIRAKTHMEETRGGKRQIIVDEIPYGVLKGTIVEKMATCVREGQVTGAAFVNDESDRKHPVRIVVDLKRDGNEDVVLNQLYNFTPLQSNYNVINIALVDRRPCTLTIKQMIEEYIRHRKDVIRRRTEFLLKRAQQRAHLREGLLLATGDIDAIIELIKESSDPPTAKARLMARPLRLTEHATLRRLLPEKFVTRCTENDQFLSGPQADEILKMQLQRLTALEMEKLAEDYAKLCEEIEGYEAILRDEWRVIDIIREDLFELKSKYADSRRSEITDAVGEFQMDELIPQEQVIVTVSHEGYVKRVPVGTYRRQGRGGKGVRGGETREGDFLEHMFVVSTHDYLLIFTNRGRVYWLRVYDVPSMSRTARGRSIANLLQMQSNEVHKAVLAVKAFEENFVLFATRKGIVKKTPLGAFSRPRPSGIIALSLDPDDALMNVGLTSGNDQVVLASRDGMAVRFDENNVRAMGRTARGVKGMDLRSGDQVVDMAVAVEGVSVLTVCENGYGKRTGITEYRLTQRGGKGVINIKTTDRNGQVVAMKTVTDDDELMLITAQGKALRTDLSALREIGRATQGVRMIRLDAGDKLVAVARIAKDDHNGDNSENGENVDNGSESDPSGESQGEATASDEPDAG